MSVSSSICAAVASVMPGIDVANGGFSYAADAMGKTSRSKAAATVTQLFANPNGAEAMGVRAGGA